MLERASKLAEQVCSHLPVSRRGFLGRIGKRTVGAALAVGTFLVLPSSACSGDSGPCSDNGDCRDGEYCQKAVGDCDGVGVCAEIPIFCLDDYVPVCGCDGAVYPNACYAAAFGVNVAHPTAGQGCGQ